MQTHTHSHELSPFNAVAEFPELLVQDYEAYSAENHEVWGILYERRMQTLRETGSTQSSPNYRRRFVAGSNRTLCNEQPKDYGS